jgi:peptidoglycan/xylan/chitin deacetylase (PgdA/CDA1 family)
MYHAMGQSSKVLDADPYYTITEAVFCEHLKHISTSIPLTTQLKNNHQITKSCITFDDGHQSNYTIAFPLLLQHHLLAEFYINTSLVGTQGYMSWDELNEMNAHGMSIQSHGHTHRYFSEMTDKDIFLELKTSKNLIETKLKNDVFVFSPPGGRVDQRVIRIAKSLGYKTIVHSRPGVIPFFYHFDLPRFAITKDTQAKKILKWQSRWSFDTLYAITRYQLLYSAKKILGNQRYEKIRSKMLGFF